MPLTVIVPSAVSVQVRLSSFHVCGSVVVSALAVIFHEIFCSVSLGKYVSVAAAMTIADERAASRFHCFMRIYLLLFQIYHTFLEILL